MSVGQARRMARDIKRMMTQRMTVYTRNAGTGAYTTQAITSVRCLLQPMNVQGVAGDSRAGMLESGTLFFDPTYTMPVQAQIVVDVFGAQRFQMVANSAWVQYGPQNVAIATTCEVRSVKST